MAYPGSHENRQAGTAIMAKINMIMPVIVIEEEKGTSREWFVRNMWEKAMPAKMREKIAFVSRAENMISALHLHPMAYATAPPMNDARRSRYTKFLDPCM